jgi:hypothetical protein
MNQSANQLSSTKNEAMLCPHCGSLLSLKGKVVDAGTFKKWAEHWHCAEHGFILLTEVHETRPASETPFRSS